jgi:glycosyltransferase involved in cell wall biosynthesis
MSPCISTIITLYNKAPYIGRALHSVLDQTVPCQEIIVVDDGSTDQGAKVVQAFEDTRIKLIRQQNQGVNRARNQGLAAARGDLIAFLDADDEWRPQFLETIIRLTQKFPHAGAFATNYHTVGPGPRVKWCPASVLPDGQREGLIENYFRVGRHAPVHNSAVAMPKRVLQELSGFLEVALGGDVELFLRVALRFPIAWSREILAVYYQDVPQQITGTSRTWQPVEPPVSRTARAALAAGLLPPDRAADLREYAAFWQVRAAMKSLERGMPELASQLLNYAQGSEWLALNRGRIFRARLLAALPGNAFAVYRKMNSLERNIRLKLKRLFRYSGPKDGS